jgi:hypothetical protein
MALSKKALAVAAFGAALAIAGSASAAGFPAIGANTKPR